MFRFPYLCTLLFVVSVAGINCQHSDSSVTEGKFVGRDLVLAEEDPAPTCVDGEIYVPQMLATIPRPDQALSSLNFIGERRRTIGVHPPPTTPMPSRPMRNDEFIASGQTNIQLDICVHDDDPENARLTKVEIGETSNFEVKDYTPDDGWEIKGLSSALFGDLQGFRIVIPQMTHYTDYEAALLIEGWQHNGTSFVTVRRGFRRQGSAEPYITSNQRTEFIAAGGALFGELTDGKWTDGFQTECPAPTPLAEGGFVSVLEADGIRFRFKVCVYRAGGIESYIYQPIAIKIEDPLAPEPVIAFDARAIDLRSRELGLCDPSAAVCSQSVHHNYCDKWRIKTTHAVYSITDSRSSPGQQCEMGPELPDAPAEPGPLRQKVTIFYIKRGDSAWRRIPLHEASTETWRWGRRLPAGEAF